MGADAAIEGSSRFGEVLGRLASNIAGGAEVIKAAVRQSDPPMLEMARRVGVPTASRDYEGGLLRDVQSLVVRLRGLSDGISRENASRALDAVDAVLKAKEDELTTVIKDYLNPRLLSFLRANYYVDQSERRNSIEKAAQKADAENKIAFARAARALKHGQFIKLFVLYAPVNFWQWLRGDYSGSVKCEVRQKDVKISTRAQSKLTGVDAQQLKDSQVATVFFHGVHQCSLEAGGVTSLTLAQSGSSVARVINEMQMLFSLQQSACGKNVLRGSRGSQIVYWARRCIFLLKC
jgi:hypothetical protein